jgi:hypothetical protein
MVPKKHATNVSKFEQLVDHILNGHIYVYKLGKKIRILDLVERCSKYNQTSIKLSASDFIIIITSASWVAWHYKPKSIELLDSLI